MGPPSPALPTGLSRANPYFAKVACHRIWADLMGRGLVEPIDDMRATNRL